jgi:hypothetical protein
MNYCLDILENTHINEPFDIRMFEKHMLLADTFIEEPEIVPVPDIFSVQQPDIVPEKVHVKVQRFMPRQQNSLFWCFFVAHFGISEYEMIGSRYQNAELEEKYRISETLEKSPDRLKATNYSPSKQSIKEMCAGIVSSTRDDFFSLIAFCAYYRTKTLVVFEQSHTYLEFDCCQSDAVPMVMRATRNNGKGAWSFSLDMSMSIATVEVEYVKLNTYLKPMKGIGSYKSDELICMASKMGLDTPEGKKEGKKELYEKIGQKIGEIV